VGIFNKALEVTHVIDDVTFVVIISVLYYLEGIFMI
jgi:hypothetical protein